MRAQFHVAGLPTPQGSKSAVIIQGRPVVIDGGTAKARRAHKAWREGVHEAARSWISWHQLSEGPWTPIDEPVRVCLTFLMPRTTSKPHRVMHATKPDIDKLVRSVLDSLTTGGLLVDDSRVSIIEASKQYADENDVGCDVVVQTMGEAEDGLSTLQRMEARRRGSKHADVSAVV